MTILCIIFRTRDIWIAVIRISGPEASLVIKKLTEKNIPEPRVATLRKINYINTSELIDEGYDSMVSWTRELHRRRFG